MVVFNSDGELSTCFVLTEGISMEVGQNAREALNLLLFTYYTLHLTYLKQYQLLGFLQHYILNDRTNDFFMCLNYLQFTMTLDEKMRHRELEGMITRVVFSFNSTETLFWILLALFICYIVYGPIYRSNFQSNFIRFY